MGEKPQQVELHLAPGAAEEIARFFRTLLERYLTTEPEPDAGPEPVYDPESLGMSGYTMPDGVAYVDERGHLRGVSPGRVTEVPSAWRRVWLGPPEGTLRP